MNAIYNNSILEASYDIVKIFGLIDVEDHNALFGEWCTIIAFKLQTSNTITLNGNFLIKSSVDSIDGISCHCHILLNYQIPTKGNITLKILKDSRTFGLKNVSGDCIEKIDIMPWYDLNGFIYHDITNGKYDEKNHVYPYRRYAGVFNGGDDKLHVFLTENEYDIKLDFHNEFIPKIKNNISVEYLLQKGQLMQKLAPSMINKINEFR